MKLKQAAAVLAAGTVSIATAATVWAEVPQAGEQTSDYDVLSLPVQILDFNRDNLFFEYDDLANGGMNLITEGEGGNIGYTYTTDADGNVKLDVDGDPVQVAYAHGLVNPTLEGTLAYSDAAQARIADTVARAVTGSTHGDDTLFHTIAQKITTGEKQEFKNLLGSTDAGWEELKQWQYTPAAPEGKTRSWFDDRYMQYPQNAEGVKELWHFAGDRVVIPAGSGAVLHRVFDVTPGTDYALSSYGMDNPEFTANTHCRIVDVADGTVLVEFDFAREQNEPTTFTTGAETRQIRVELSAKDTAQDAYVSALYFKQRDAADTPNYFAGDDRFAWKDADDLGYTDANGALTYYNGTTLLTHDTDGFTFGSADATLSRSFAVTPGSSCTLEYWTGGAGTVVRAEADGAGLANSGASDANGGMQTLTFTVPTEASAVTITIQAAPGVKVAAMNLTAAPAVRVGNDDDVRDFASWQRLLDANELTAREYTAYMLGHLFTPAEGLNTQVDEYDNLVLRRQEDGSYLFDSEQPIVYDTASSMMYNDAERGESRNGFFPVDGLGFNENTATQFDPEGVEHTQHNYHFTLRSGGTFVYRKGLYFDFSGDDDVYMFINNQLVLDLGGAHLKASKRVDLDKLDLTVGETYNFDFFYMERHTDASNLRISTNIDVQRRVENEDAKVIQNVQFVLDGLTTPPEELYVQAYCDGQPYDSPMKFTPEELARRLELEGGHDYTFKLLTDVSDYELTTEGEWLVAADEKDVEKTWTYILHEKKTTPTPAPVVTPAPSQNGGNNSTTNKNTTTTVTQTVTAPAAAKAQPAAAIPQTADDSHPLLLAILCVSGAVGFCAVSARKKYHH